MASPTLPFLPSATWKPKATKATRESLRVLDKDAERRASDATDASDGANNYWVSTTHRGEKFKRSAAKWRWRSKV